jgi:hypothetical protein
MSEVREASVQEMSGADGTSPGAASVKVDDVGPQPSDDIGRLLRDLVIRGTGIGVPESAALGDVAPTPGSSGDAGLGVSGLLLPGSPSFPPPPIDWRRVGDEVEFACSQVASAERLLHETLASVDQNILRPIRVSLKKRKNCQCASGFLHAFSSPLALVFVALVSG